MNTSSSDTHTADIGYLYEFVTNLIAKIKLTEEWRQQYKYEYKAEYEGANSKTFISDFEKFSLWFQAPFTILLSAFGIVSNLIIFIVFYRQGVLSDSCTAILTAMAVSDWIYCVMVFVLNAWRIVDTALHFSSNYARGYRMETTNELAEISTRVFLQFNCLATAYLALERMASVMFPFDVKRYFKPRRSCCAMAAIFLVCLILQLDVYVTHAVSSQNPELFYEHRLFSVLSQWGRVSETINHVGIRLLSVVLVVVFNIIIIVKVNILGKFRESNSSAVAVSALSRGRGDNKATTNQASTSRETRLTRLMSAVCLLFFVCFIPRVVYVLVDRYGYRTGLGYNSLLIKDVVQYVEICLPVLELANSAANVIIYYALSSKFKDGFKKLSCSCRTKIEDSKKS